MLSVYPGEPTVGGVRFSSSVIVTGESENGKTAEGTQRKRRRRGRVGACSDPGDKGRIQQLWLGLFAGLHSSFTAAKFNSLTCSESLFQPSLIFFFHLSEISSKGTHVSLRWIPCFHGRPDAHIQAFNLPHPLGCGCVSERPDDSQPSSHLSPDFLHLLTSSIFSAGTSPVPPTQRWELADWAEPFSPWAILLALFATPLGVLT